MLERLASTLANEPDPFRIRSVLNSYRGHLSHFIAIPARDERAGGHLPARPFRLLFSTMLLSIV